MCFEIALITFKCACLGVDFHMPLKTFNIRCVKLTLITHELGFSVIFTDMSSHVMQCIVKFATLRAFNILLCGIVFLNMMSEGVRLNTLPTNVARD